MKQERATLTRYKFMPNPDWANLRWTRRSQGVRVRQLHNCILDDLSVWVRSSNQIGKYCMHQEKGWPEESRVYMELRLNWESRDDSYVHAHQFQSELNEALSGSKFSALPISSGVLSPDGCHQQLAFSHPRHISMDREVFDLINRFNQATGLTWNATERLSEVTQQTYLKVKGKWISYVQYIVDRAKRAQAPAVQSAEASTTQTVTQI